MIILITTIFLLCFIVVFDAFEYVNEDDDNDERDKFPSEIPGKKFFKISEIHFYVRYILILTHS